LDELVRKVRERSLERGVRVAELGLHERPRAAAVREEIRRQGSRRRCAHIHVWNNSAPARDGQPERDDEERHVGRAIRCLAAVALLGTSVFAASPRGGAVTRWDPVVNAPEFPSGLEWLNVDRPLKLSDLRGKVVLLDFWTYCCINCMHIVPDLGRLEKKYGSSLVVVGVHSAKFTTEQGTDNIRQAILRYGIEHPVVND